MRPLDETLRRHVELLDHLQADCEHDGARNLTNPDYRAIATRSPTPRPRGNVPAIERQLLDLLELWRVDFDAVREALEARSVAESRPPARHKAASLRPPF